MPEEPNTPEPGQQPETPAEPGAPAEPETPPEGGKGDPWSDPEAARKEIEKLRKESAKYRTRAHDLEPLAKKAKELEDAQKSEAERLGEQLTQQQEKATKALRAAVAAKVEALAAKTFEDPADPVGELDLTAYIDDDGAIDSAAITKDLADVLKRKPHWAKAPEARPPRPDRTQGSSGNGNRTPSDPGAEFADFMKRALDRGR